MAVVLILFLSFGFFFFFALCSFSFYWFFVKVKICKSGREVEIIRADEHFKAKEDIVKGPNGSQAVVITIEEDKRFEGEKIHKDKKREAADFAGGKAGEINTVDLVEGGSSFSKH